jgi:phosphoribosyl-ATP pyrophosphohydrolase
VALSRLFFATMTFDEIYSLVLSRKQEMPPGASTTVLFEKGTHAIGKKLVEEAAESWMAARYESREAVALELSQVLYYVACMMAETGVTKEEVYGKL